MTRDARRTSLALAGVTLVYLLAAWPGAATRGILAEEITPYLHTHPRVILRADEHGLALAPPHDAATSDGPGWVRTPFWPNLAYRGETRTWPVLLRGHMSALGSLPGIALEAPLGGGIVGLRRATVLLGLGIVWLVFALGRRLGLTPGLAAAASLACALSPGLLFFPRASWGFEVTSRLCMLLALVLAAAPGRVGRGRGLLVGLCLAAAIASRATIAATLIAPLLLVLTHPRRRDPGGITTTFIVGLGAPLLAISIALAAIGVYTGTAPAAHLDPTSLAARTLVAPAYLAGQLRWVVDARWVLGPLLAGHRELAPTLAPLLLGLAVLGLAARRWSQGCASEPETLFVAAAIGNALGGAWLYGEARQFQLAMALEPLFVLACAAQLQRLHACAPRLALAACLVALTSRGAQLAQHLALEARTGNPMLSGAAQRALARVLQAEAAPTDEIVTTTYNHVGLLEAWTADAVRPLHGFAVLRRQAPDRLLGAWQAILRDRPVRFLVLDSDRNAFDGPFTDDHAIARALDTALRTELLTVTRTWKIACESGDVCMTVLELAPAAG